MGYQAIIAKASTKYRWPSWVVYDPNFRQEVAGNNEQAWSKVDQSIYALSFTGQACTSENWCSRCQCLDHTSQNCPGRPSRKRPWDTALAGRTHPYARSITDSTGTASSVDVPSIVGEGVGVSLYEFVMLWL